MSDSDNAIKAVMHLATSYEIQTVAEDPDKPYYRLVIHVEKVPGVTIPVTFDYLSATDLKINGFEVPQ